MPSILAFFCTLFSGQLLHGQIADPGNADTVQIQSTTSSGTGTASLPIYFSNDEALGGLEITIHHQSENVIIDAVSFSGGRIAGIANKGVIVQGNELTIYCIPFPGSIPAGSGLLATIQVSFSPSLPAEIVIIDSITIQSGERIYSTTFSTVAAETFKPQFRPATLSINPCCIGLRGNVNNDVNDRLDILDLTYLISYMFGSYPEPVCKDEANPNAIGPNRPDVLDLTYLVMYFFGGGPPPLPCPGN